jgi:hypothetical protein
MNVRLTLAPCKSYFSDIEILIDITLGKHAATSPIVGTHMHLADSALAKTSKRLAGRFYQLRRVIALPHWLVPQADEKQTLGRVLVVSV